MVGLGEAVVGVVVCGGLGWAGGVWMVLVVALAGMAVVLAVVLACPSSTVGLWWCREVMELC